ncbi:hypothetical protein ACFL08_01175 [Patescibacteria group bacterium]
MRFIFVLMLALYLFSGPANAAKEYIVEVDEGAVSFYGVHLQWRANYPNHLITEAEIARKMTLGEAENPYISETRELVWHDFLDIAPRSYLRVTKIPVHFSQEEKNFYIQGNEVSFEESEIGVEFLIIQIMAIAFFIALLAEMSFGYLVFPKKSLINAGICQTLFVSFPLVNLIVEVLNVSFYPAAISVIVFLSLAISTCVLSDMKFFKGVMILFAMFAASAFLPVSFFGETNLFNNYSAFIGITSLVYWASFLGVVMSIDFTKYMKRRRLSRKERIPSGVVEERSKK